MAGKLCRHVLVLDDLIIKMMTATEGHDEEPGLEDSSGEGIDNVWSLATVCLCRFIKGKIQDASSLCVDKVSGFALDHGQKSNSP